MGRGEIRGYERGARKRQAMQSGTYFAKTGGFRLHGPRLFHACWGAAPIPAEHKNCVLERWINPSAARFFKSLVGGQLSAAPPLFPVVHSLPPAPCPVPEYGRYWLWPSAALSLQKLPLRRNFLYGRDLRFDSFILICTVYPLQMIVESGTG